MIIKILYLIFKHLCHRNLLAEENVEFYVSNINFATSSSQMKVMKSKNIFC
jgi:hypothetical protein